MSYPIEEKLLKVNEYTRPGIKLSSVKGVVIHWTANEEKGANRVRHFTYFNTHKVYASAHYFVDSEGILRIIPENEMAYHVGAKSYRTTRFGTYPNKTMIGVEMCVNPDGNFEETYKRAVWLCADLVKRHKLDVDKDLVRHYDITGKDCPKMFVTDSYGQKFMGLSAAQAYAKFKKDVKAAVEGKTTSPQPAATPKPAATTTTTSTESYIGKRAESKVNALRFYAKPSWEDKDVAGTLKKGEGFPNILAKVKVGTAYQYKVKNSKGAIFYVTASSTYITVK